MGILQQEAPRQEAPHRVHKEGMKCTREKCIHWACLNGDINVFQELMREMREDCIDINKIECDEYEDQTPLELVVDDPPQAGQPGFGRMLYMMDALLRAGADMCPPGKDHVAFDVVFSEVPTGLMMLRKYGADLPSLRDSVGRCLLHNSCTVRVTRYLFSIPGFEALVNLQDQLGSTPLDRCLGNEYDSGTLHQLLLHGARTRDYAL